MPKIARWNIKTALVYFILALMVGVLLQARNIIHLPSWVNNLNPVYIHLLVVGWITQLIIGVAYWLFPIYTRERPRGSDTLGWASYILLNVGLILRAVAEPRLTAHTRPDPGSLLAISAVLQVIAGWLFVLNTWPRVKERP